MERAVLFINNDLSMLLSREESREYFEKENGKEQEPLHREAELIIKDPVGRIDSLTLLRSCTRYEDVKNNYLDLFIEGSDEEQLNSLRNLEDFASLILLPDAVLIAGGSVIDKEDYPRWLELIYALKYIPLQKAFFYCLNNNDSFIGVLRSLDVNRLAYPKTFLWLLFAHWVEWIIRAGGHLLSYNDEKGLYGKNEKAQQLIKEAGDIKDGWEKEMPEMICGVLAGFTHYVSPCDLLVWITKKPIRDDASVNPYSANYNHYLSLICSSLYDSSCLSTISDEDLNMNLLMLMVGKAVEEQDAVLGKEIHTKLLRCLKKENFSNLNKKSELDEKRQRLIAQLIILAFPELDFNELLINVATQFQGWNVDYRQVYDNARSEAYYFCCLFRVFTIKSFDDENRFVFWKKLVDNYLQEYRRCENVYITRDEFNVPFRVAVTVAEELADERCRDYLHQVMLENVLSIVSLLTVFSECDMFLSSEIVAKLLERIDKEWQSAKILMEARGQRNLEIRIESLIKQLGEFKAEAIERV